MKVNSASTKTTSPPILTAVGLILVLSIFLLTNERTGENAAPNVLNLPAIDRATTPEALTYSALFNSTDYKVYNDSRLTIYLVKAAGIPKLIYAYKGDLSGRDLTDNFFLHVYIKDNKNLRDNAPFANVDFVQIPKKFELDGQTYSVFKRDLVSGNYDGNFIPPEDIAYFNTGRYKPKSSRSLDLKNIKVDGVIAATLENELDKLTIQISSKGFTAIKNKREEALKTGVLVTGEKDYVKGSVQLNNGNKKNVKLRLKGDWTDHLKHERKWSYRILMEDGKTCNGMRKFSIQHPTVRYYLWEWLFHRAIKGEGIIGLRYDFVDTSISISNNPNQKIPLGIMAFEESFDKILIENNKKREGIILAFDESQLWQDRAKQRILGLDDNAQSIELHKLANAPIKVFNENKVLSDTTLSKQFKVAKDLLEGLRQNKYKISEVFDIDRLTSFVALSNLFGGGHGLIWHNLRIYYNPITNKLEPISFDSGSGTKINAIIEYPLVNDDPVYQELLLEKFKKYSDASFFNSFVKNYSNKLQALENSFYTEFQTQLDFEVIAHNSNFIKKQINPAVAITANLISYDQTFVEVEIKNLSNYPVQINELQDDKGVVLGKLENTRSLNPQEKITANFILSDYFSNAFVSKKNKKGGFQYPKDVSHLRLAHKITGIDIPKMATLKPYGTNPNLTSTIELYKKSQYPTFQNFPFIEKKNDSILYISKGEYTIANNLKIPEDYTLVIAPGTKIDLTKGASIISKATFLCEGTSDQMIHFTSSDQKGGGIFVTNASSTSKITHTHFNNLSNPTSEIWSVSGAVNFHESDVTITNSSFSNNKCEDGLNIIRSSFTITDTLFEGAQSDAFDGDFVSGTLERCTFLNSGNDSIDVSGSNLIIKNITIYNPSDKGISAGENSSITGEKIKITGGEIGIVSKDLSAVQLNNVSISGTRLGISAFQKKSEYGVASIDLNTLLLKDVEVAHLIEVNSRLTVDAIAVQTVSNNVIDQMYGKEYGKSTK